MSKVGINKGNLKVEDPTKSLINKYVSRSNRTKTNHPENKISVNKIKGNPFV